MAGRDPSTGAREPALGLISGSPASSRGSGLRSLRPRCARCWASLAFRPDPSGHDNRGGRSCVSRAASALAGDVFTVETLAPQRIDVLFFISLATRRLESIACTANPDSAWVTQQARNLVIQLGEQGGRFELLIHDRDTTFSRAFDEVFRTEGIEVIRTPVRNAERERLRRALGTHRPQPLPRSDPHLRTPTSRTSAARVQPPLQRAPAAPRPPAHTAQRRRQGRSRSPTRRVRDPSTRPPRRTDPRVPTSSVIGFTHPTRASPRRVSRRALRTARAEGRTSASHHRPA